MSAIFISDLHIDEQAEHISETLRIFLASTAKDVDSIYILGDLFESWIGPDDPDPSKQETLTRLGKCVERGQAVYFMQGNRDFLISETDVAPYGIRFLADPRIINMYGTAVTLCHGDHMCTDDHEYQAFRLQSRDPEWQNQVLKFPIAQRLAMREQARKESQIHQTNVSDDIMDVNDDAVKAFFLKQQTPVMIHGHTHRPQAHVHDINSQAHHRLVLGDWYEQGIYLYWDESGYEFKKVGSHCETQTARHDH